MDVRPCFKAYLKVELLIKYNETKSAHHEFKRNRKLLSMAIQ